MILSGVVQLAKPESALSPKSKLRTCYAPSMTPEVRKTGVLPFELQVLSKPAVWENCVTTSIRLRPKGFPKMGSVQLFKQLLVFSTQVWKILNIFRILLVHIPNWSFLWGSNKGKGSRNSNYLNIYFSLRVFCNFSNFKNMHSPMSELFFTYTSKSVFEENTRNRGWEEAGQILPQY